MTNLLKFTFLSIMVLLFLDRFGVFSKISTLFWSRWRISGNLEESEMQRTASFSFGNLLKDSVPRSSKSSQASHAVNVIMIVILTLALSSTSLYVILSQNFEESEQKWAFGVVGTLVGYWFKRPNT